MIDTNRRTRGFQSIFVPENGNDHHGLLYDDPHPPELNPGTSQPASQSGGIWNLKTTHRAQPPPSKSETEQSLNTVPSKFKGLILGEHHTNRQHRNAWRGCGPHAKRKVTRWPGLWSNSCSLTERRVSEWLLSSNRNEKEMKKQNTNSPVCLTKKRGSKDVP